MKEENYKIIDEYRVEKVSKNILDDDFLVNVAELFKVFGDSSRIKIICALLQEELCVGDIASIVKTRREGKLIYYSLKDEHVKKIFKIGCEHIEEL